MSQDKFTTKAFHPFRPIIGDFNFTGVDAYDVGKHYRVDILSILKIVHLHLVELVGEENATIHIEGKNFSFSVYDVATGCRVREQDHFVAFKFSIQNMLKLIKIKDLASLTKTLNGHLNKFGVRVEDKEINLEFYTDYAQGDGPVLVLGINLNYQELAEDLTKAIESMFDVVSDIIDIATVETSPEFMMRALELSQATHRALGLPINYRLSFIVDAISDKFEELVDGDIENKFRAIDGVYLEFSMRGKEETYAILTLSNENLREDIVLEIECPDGLDRTMGMRSYTFAVPFSTISKTALQQAKALSVLNNHVTILDIEERYDVRSYRICELTQTVFVDMRNLPEYPFVYKNAETSIQTDFERSRFELGHVDPTDLIVKLFYCGV